VAYGNVLISDKSYFTFMELELLRITEQAGHRNTLCNAYDTQVYISSYALCFDMFWESHLNISRITVVADKTFLEYGLLLSRLFQTAKHPFQSKRISL